MTLAQLLPWSVWDCWWLAPLALIMDLLLGDPRLPWRHPVCAIGSFLNFAEKICRHFAAANLGDNSGRREKLAGCTTLAITCLCVYKIVYALDALPFAGAVFAIYFAWSGLAMGCLLETGAVVRERLQSGGIAAAREGVGWLVSRDVSQLDRPLLAKTLADTLSENFTDAFLAPFFWLLVCGPPGLWLYKTVSTMDSQWGYLTPKWQNLGWAGARMDDLLAWLPGRLSPFALGLAHALAWRRAWQGLWPGLVTIARDAKGMPSPNSGWPMAACAWLCWGRMAGPSVYFGELVQKGWIGPASARPWTRQKLESLMRLMFWGAICGGCALWLLLVAASILLKI